jgi:outer membrane protein assembly factor BamB
LPDPLVERWRFATGDSIEAAPIVVRGVAYIASQDGHLYAVSLGDGTQKWRFKAPAPLKTSAGFSRGRVYVGDVDGNFFCLDATSGMLIWKFVADGEITSGAAFAEDRVLFGSGDESLYCLDSKGQKLWQFQVPGGPVLGTPSIQKGQTFISGCDSTLHVVDVSSGKEVRSIEIGGQTGAAPAWREGMLYLATMSNTVVAVDLEKSTLAWTFESGRGQPFYASTAVTDRYVIAGGRDKRVYCLDRATGKRIWDFVTSGRIEGSPVVAGDRVYAGSLDGHLYVIDLKQGIERQRIKLDSAATSSLAVADGCVLIGTEKGTVYCFGKK